MRFIEFVKALLLGIVEGITEWLPVSSTGHMIILDNFIKLDVSEAFMELFLVVIQLGAILAVAVLYFSKLNPFSPSKSREEKRSTLTLWSKVIVGAIPAAIIGFLLDDFLDTHFYNYYTVSVALVVYGILFILIEYFRKKNNKPFRVETVDDISYTDALKIGAFQVLSLIPGTSRSGSTMLGGISFGISRVASAEFSFFMAIPIMLGASGLKLIKFIMEGSTVSGEEIGLLLVGIAVSFLVSLFAIKFLLDFVKRHDFKPFGIYRIVLGAIVFGYFLVKTLMA